MFTIFNATVLQYLTRNFNFRSLTLPKDSVSVLSNGDVMNMATCAILNFPVATLTKLKLNK